ncbi:MAG TPA: hypothetical protein VJ927_03840 [Actinomycetota bacterium]|nr:hypothetical protein [Actinomycetota bacterium]
MTPRRGAIVPHAPLLAPDISGSHELGALEGVRAAARAVARAWSPPTVLISPHGSRSGVYRSTRGDLGAFGVPRAHALGDIDTRASEVLSERWGRPFLEEPLDHGIVVPLLITGYQGPLVAVALAEEGDLAEDVGHLAKALADLDGATVVASVNSGAGITSRAPLTELPGAAALEDELAEALRRDVGSVADLARRLRDAGGSCAMGPLLVLAHLFDGIAAVVDSHEWPVGVGYLVASMGA